MVTGIANPLYVKTDTAYGSNGNPASETWFRGDGSVYQTETWSADGSFTIHKA